MIYLWCTFRVCRITFIPLCSHTSRLVSILHVRNTKQMPVSSLSDLSASQKEDLVASLSAIVVGSTDGEISADALSAVAKEAGCDLSGAMASLFASVVDKSGGVEKFTLAPGGG